MVFEINQKIHSLEDVKVLLQEDSRIVLGPQARKRIVDCREYLDNRMKTQKEPIYGITTGFGSLCNVSIDPEDLSQLQKNLVMSHACSIGEEVPQEIVKLMMAFKIKSLSYGYSGVQLKTVERLVEMFNNKVYPVVYQQGSLGASGDLAPLANMCLPLLGLGEVRYNGEKLPAAQVCSEFGWVDLYIGGTEHATGHLIYSRFWNKFLFDLGYVCEKEPFRKLINQGMIQGRSNFVYRIINTNTFVSLGLKDQYETTEIHVDVNIVHNDRLDMEAFRAWMPDFANAEFILEDGEYICGWAVEKMSKSMFNVVNPDMICDTYGADTLRLYEMFLGPLEQSKPWDTKGIDGVNRFLKKVWRMFYDRDGFIVTDEKATPDELKALHKLIGKVRADIEAFSFNTAVSAFMIAVNELTDLKCTKREILEQLTVLLSPFAPHIAEELWEALGHKESITYASFPEYIEAYTIENNCTYAVSFNGKTRFTVELPVDMSREDVDAHVRGLEQTAKYVADGNIVKVIVVPGKIVNIVVK